MKLDVKVTGPFFRLGSGPVMDALHDAVSEAVVEGETKVSIQLYPGHGLVTGHYRRSIHGEMLSSLHGTIDDSKVVYGPWLEGVSSRNDRTRFKGYGMFRLAGQQLQRMAPDILRKHIDRALARLG